MKFGACRGVEDPNNVVIAKKAGFDYVECGFHGLSTCEDEVFEAFKKALEDNDIKCEAANGFIPRDMKVLGDEMDVERLKAYIEKGMYRGSLIGMETVVFGSGKARNIPEGMEFGEAFKQLGSFLRDIACPIAKKYGITIVIEPLRADESTIIHTITEGVMLATLAGCDNVAGLADIYHMLGCGDTNETVISLKGGIKHGHISNPVERGNFKRVYPADVNEFDYKGFVDALAKAGCERCSVEANTDDFANDAPPAAAVLKNL